MDTMLWLAIAIAGGIVFIYAIFSLILRWKKGDVDYRNLYTVGLSLLPLGIIFITENTTFGALYLIASLLLIGIGLKNKDKWRNIVLTPEQKKRRTKILIAGVVIALLGVLVVIFYSYV